MQKMRTHKCLAIAASILSLAAVANAQTDISSQFVNLDFDSGGVSGPFDGFDAPGSPEIIGWNNMPNAFAPNLDDAGVEASGAWWGTYQANSAFMADGDGAYNLSSYTIQAGDQFSIDFFAKCWWDDGLWTVSLFYDTPANVIGTYSTPGTTVPHWSWSEYSTTTPITATVASEGHQLGILFVSSGAGVACLDEVVVTVTPVPEPGTMALLALGGTSLLLWRRRQTK
jgi:hypothetical protein